MSFWWILTIVPKNLLSRLVGYLAALPLPQPLRRLVLRWFVQRYHLRLDEAEKPFSEYHSLQELFTRRLRPGLRPILGELVHPCDAELTRMEPVTRETLTQAKGFKYSIRDLLGDASESFAGGTALTYYLCPTDYHRVHAPLAAQISQVRYIPGTLWPVNPWSVTHVPRLFARNERMVIWLESAYGRVALVMIGATNVGQISLAFDPELRSNLGTKGQLKTYASQPRLNAGDELGTFHMGSSVVLLLPARLNVSAQLGPVRLGQRLL